jgi:type III secretion system YscD/HrpQ family protein
MPAHLIVEEGPYQGLVLNFEEGEQWIIGRDPDQADCVIEDSTVSRKHARIDRTEDGLKIKNLSRVNPTLINDQVLVEQVVLQANDRIKIGPVVFVFSEQNLPAKEQPKNKKKQKDKGGGYDDIFGDLEEPELPPEPEPVEEHPPILPSAKEEEPEPAKTAYDTIFEDIASSGEMPFNLLSETPLLLKVIGGPNSGAEIGLEKGRTYLIGKDPNTCDIVFQDLSVSRNHSKLTISQDGIIEIEDLGSKNGTLINGVPLLAKHLLTTQDIIAMGTTIFLIIDREAAQETIYSPMLSTYEPHRETPSAEVKEGREQPLGLEEEVLPSETPDWKTQKIPMKHLVIAGSIAAMVLIMFVTFFSLFKSEPVELVHKLPHDAIKHALAKFPGVQFTFNPSGGKLFLSGHVLTNIEFQELHYNLSQIPSILSEEGSVVIDEMVSKTVNGVISSNGAWKGVNIESVKPGQFLAQGYVDSQAQALQLSEYLKKNFPYTDRLENKVVVEELLSIQIQGMLLSSGFGAVNLQLSGGEVILSGRYSEKKESEYKDLLIRVNKLHGVSSVKNLTISSSPSQASINLSQNYKVTGVSLHDKEGFNAVINGKIYGIGQIMDGMIVSSIKPNEILLEKDGLNYTIDYTR